MIELDLFGQGMHQDVPNLKFTPTLSMTRPFLTASTSVFRLIKEDVGDDVQHLDSVYEVFLDVVNFLDIEGFLWVC